MNEFIRYIEETFPHTGKDGKILHKFKKQVLEDMEERANDLVYSGMKDQKVLYELVESDHPDLEAEYKIFKKIEKRKQFRKDFVKFDILGSLLFIIGIISSFLFLGMNNGDWKHIWIIVANGFLLWTSFQLTCCAIRLTHMKRIFQIPARILLALAVSVIAVATMLFILVQTNLPHFWLAMIGGIIGIFVVDGIYAYLTKQPMFIINILIYNIVISPFVYILISTIEILPWSAGWIVMIIAIVLDIIIIIGAIANNKKYVYKQEAGEQW